MAIWIVLAVVFFSIFPAFHVRKIGTAGGREAVSDVAGVASQFWRDSLLSRRAPPVDVQMLLSSLSKDPVSGGDAFGHRPGIGGPLFYYISGKARVSAVDQRGIWLDAGGTATRVLLQNGPIFGSALRDSTGTLKLEDFSSFDFNALALRLNLLSESVAHSEPWRSVRVGSKVTFLAAGRFNTGIGDGNTLLMAPIEVKVE